MNTTEHKTPQLPMALRIVAGYFILIGALSFALPLLHSNPRSDEADAKRDAYRVGYTIGSQARTFTLSALYMVCGVGLFGRRSWARKCGFFALAANTLYGAYAFAWGFAHGRPNPGDLVMSFVIVGAWNAIWFCLLYRRSVAHALS